MTMTQYVPTKAEAREVAAAKNRDIILDTGDLAAMSEIVRDLGDAASNDKQRELVAELDGFLDFLRLQLG
jgi:hypothetical protein